MSCETIGNATICRPPVIYGRRVMVCPNCEVRRRIVVHWMGAYYGESGRCVACGDGWMDGEMLERPFRRGWRERARRDARRRWDEALNAADYTIAVRADIKRALA